MSKSLGNFVSIKDALAEYRPEVIRYFMLSAHYSSPVTYSPDALSAAANGWERVNNAVRLVRQTMLDAQQGDEGNSFSERLDRTRDDFKAAMDDDFNAPRALAVLQELTRDVNSLLNSETIVSRAVLEAIDDTYKSLGGDVLGVIPQQDTATGGDSEREAKLIQLLIDQRARARAEKNYAESDRIRDELAAAGVILEDRADGTIWKLTT
jgi:cysteinyl-tRNA synthetase